MSNTQKRILAALLSLTLCSCSAKTGESSDSSAAPDEVSSTPVTSTAADNAEELPLIKGFKGKSDANGFSFEWKEQKNIDGYEIHMRPAGNGSEEIYYVAADLTKYEIANKKPGECALFDIRAFLRKGKDIEYTAVSKEIQLTVMRESCVLSVQNVCQYSKPALPTGCECAALTSLLKHCGFDVTKNEIAADYLKKIPFTEKKIKGSKGETQLYGADPDEAFPGDPADENSYGCYSKPLVDAANKYLKTQDTGLRAKDLTGKKLSSLYAYVNNGSPVVVWATNGLKASKKTDSWLTAEGKEITWLYNEHCLVLVGYNMDKKVVYCSDPSQRSVTPIEYDAALFEKRYKEQGSHALVIE